MNYITQRLVARPPSMLHHAWSSTNLEPSRKLTVTFNIYLTHVLPVIPNWFLKMFGKHYGAERRRGNNFENTKISCTEVSTFRQYIHRSSFHRITVLSIHHVPLFLGSVGISVTSNKQFGSLQLTKGVSLNCASSQWLVVDVSAKHTVISLWGDVCILISLLQYCCQYCFSPVF